VEQLFYIILYKVMTMGVLILTTRTRILACSNFIITVK
jgi:hypothetical protein